MKFQSLQAISFLSAFLFMRKHWTQQQKRYNVEIFVREWGEPGMVNIFFNLYEIWDLKFSSAALFMKNRWFFRMEIFPCLNEDI